MADASKSRLDEPPLQELLEALKILVTGAKTHHINQIKNCKHREDGNHGDPPTLATLARQYNLKKTNEVLVRVLVILSTLFCRLRSSCHGMQGARKRFFEFFQILDKESSKINHLSQNFSTAKESRHKMEEDITKIRNSLDIILQQLERLRGQSHTQHDNQDNRITEVLAELDLDWTNIDDARNELPEGYLSASVKDYEKLSF